MCCGQKCGQLSLVHLRSSSLRSLELWSGGTSYATRKENINKPCLLRARTYLRHRAGYRSTSSFRIMPVLQPFWLRAENQSFTTYDYLMEGTNARLHPLDKCQLSTNNKNNIACNLISKQTSIIIILYRIHTANARAFTVGYRQYGCSISIFYRIPVQVSNIWSGQRFCNLDWSYFDAFFESFFKIIFGEARKMCLK